MCSSRVSFGCLMSLSQPGSPEKIIFDHGLDLSDTFWRDVLHAVCTPRAGPVDQMSFSSCGGLLRYSRSLQSAYQFAFLRADRWSASLCCVLPRYQMDPSFA